VAGTALAAVLAWAAARGLSRSGDVAHR